MRSITDRDAVTAALTDATLDPELRALIGLRVWQVDTDRRRPLGDILQIVVVQPGDSAEVIHDAVGFKLCWDQADQPGWEWFNDHGSWFELAYVLTDDWGLLVYVADHPDTNGALLFNCRGVANRPPGHENKS
ncbi:MAG TPA: hypothetical protein VFF48_00440 [Brevundimonas sp.]|nr:hypothetical protein [Brevundimonas sp.]